MPEEEWVSSGIVRITVLDWRHHWSTKYRECNRCEYDWMEWSLIFDLCSIDSRAFGYFIAATWSENSENKRGLIIYLQSIFYSTPYLPYPLITVVLRSRKSPTSFMNSSQSSLGMKPWYHSWWEMLLPTIWDYGRSIDYRIPIDYIIEVFSLSIFLLIIAFILRILIFFLFVLTWWFLLLLQKPEFRQQYGCRSQTDIFMPFDGHCRFSFALIFIGLARDWSLLFGQPANGLLY